MDIDKSLALTNLIPFKQKLWLFTDDAQSNCSRTTVLQHTTR